MSWFYFRDRMELQDALKSCDWNVTTTMEKLSSDMKAISEKQKFVPKEKKPKHRVEAHAHFEMSDDESEEEEFRDNKFVYDSDSDAEEEEINEDALPEDKKRVLNFFNTGNPPELAAIQGCSKKKVELIFKMRPYESWGDLVAKVRSSKQLSTEILNNCVVL